MNRFLLWMSPLLLGLGLTSEMHAASKEQSLLPLKRMTVGPSDNFQATVDEAETFLYYTRSENLSSRVMRLDLKSGISQAVTGGDADAKTPALSPNGKGLAINYFKDDAKGDICFVKEKDIDCITQHGIVDHSPVWLGNDRLAYISSDDSGRQSQLKVYDVAKKTTDVIFKGELYAPDLSPDGKTLVFKGKRNELVLYDLSARKIIRTLLVDLPGLTGPSRFSADGRYLYFAQYMLDSNRDLIIDGRDAAAIYIYDTKDTRSVKPTQVTSLDQNCSFPYPSKRYLYMTCAFEGALDIYRGPLLGTVPSDWTYEDLVEAHQVARSYSDRILYLNHQHARFFKIDDPQYEDRLMQNFVFAGEFLPADYYIQKLIARNPADSGPKALQILFDAYARWEVLPQKKNLGAFAEFIRDRRKALADLGKSDLVTLTDAYLDFFSNQFPAAQQKLEKLQFGDDLSLYLQARLAKLSLKESYPKFLESRVLNVEATEQNKLFYLSLWLKELPQGKDPTAALSSLKTKVKGTAADLVENELDLYRLVQSKERLEMLANYRLVVQRVKKLQDNYFAIRLLFNRSILVLYQNKRSREMADILSLWLTYLKRESKEFPFAVEAMRQNSLDLAYQFYHATNGDQKFAIGSFYDSIRISDDLESHYQYALLNLDRWPELTANYGTMISQGLIKPESLTFVQSVRKIVRPSKALELKDYEEAAQQIEAIDDLHLGVGVKYLYLGYLYQKQLEMTLKGFEYDADLAEKAHKSYLFAIDGALQNDRVQASALQNLAVMHLQIRNYTLASEFFTQRHGIPYLTAEEELGVLWLKAKSMYLSYRSGDAYQTMKEALLLKPAPPALEAFQEKAAFYAWNAGESAEAAQLFAGLPQAKLSPSIRLGYAHTLLAIGKPAEAHEELQKVFGAIPAGAPAIDAAAPALVVQPVKLRFVALGLIAQGPGINSAAKVAALEERLKLYPSIIDNAKKLHFQKEALSDQFVKEWQDLAQLYVTLGQKDKAQAALSRSLSEADKHGDAFSYLNNTLITALKNALIMSHRSTLAVDAAKTRAIVTKLDKEFNEQKEFTALVVQKWAELKLIQAAFLDRDFAKAKAGVFGSKALENLKREKPELYTGLEHYGAAVGQDL